MRSVCSFSSVLLNSNRLKRNKINILHNALMEWRRFDDSILHEHDKRAFARSPFVSDVFSIFGERDDICINLVFGRNGKPQTAN